jgi:hypothetical protein
MPVLADIFDQQGIFSVLEREKSRREQDLENMWDEGEQ